MNRFIESNTLVSFKYGDVVSLKMSLMVEGTNPVIKPLASLSTHNPAIQAIRM